MVQEKRYVRCEASVRWENTPWPFGPEFRCRYHAGHKGEHKWFGGDEKGDYDLWFGKFTKYDYQLEEFE